MDYFKFFIGDAKNVTKENLIRTGSNGHPLGKKYLLYRNGERSETDWYLTVYLKQIGFKTRVTIMGSIRKWFYGRYTFNDLTKEDFEECIDLIAERLRLSENEMWGARTMNCEVSLSLILKPGMAYFVETFVDYKGFIRMPRGNSYLDFIGHCKSLKFYNAGRKVWEERCFSERKIKRIESYFLRYRVELKIMDLSHIERRMEEMLSDPGKILKNWNEIYSHLRVYIGQIECYGIPSDKRIELKGGSRRDFLNYLLHAGVAYNTPLQCFGDIQKLRAGKARFEAKKLLKGILENMGSHSSDKDQFLECYDRKVARICPT